MSAAQLASRLLHDLDLLLREAIKFVDELVDLPVGGFDLALKAGFVVLGFSRLIQKRPSTPYPS